jgi:hypothetical protein
MQTKRRDRYVTLRRKAVTGLTHSCAMTAALGEPLPPSATMATGPIPMQTDKVGHSARRSSWVLGVATWAGCRDACPTSSPPIEDDIGCRTKPPDPISLKTPARHGTCACGLIRHRFLAECCKNGCRAIAGRAPSQGGRRCAAPLACASKPRLKMRVSRPSGQHRGGGSPVGSASFAGPGPLPTQVG